MIREEVPAAGRRRRGVLLKRIVLVGGSLLAVLLLARGIWDRVEARRLGALRLDLERAFGSLRPASLAPPEVQAVDNQARFFRAAADLLLIEMNDRKVLRQYLGRPPGGSPPPEEPRVREIVERNREALHLVEEGARRRASNWGIDYARAIHARPPHLLSLMDLSRLLHAQAALAARSGSAAEAAASLGLSAALWRSLRDEPTLITQFARVAVMRWCLAGVRDLLTACDPPREVLERLESMVRSMEGAAAIHRGLLGELKSMDATLGLMGEGDLVGDASIGPWQPGRLAGWLLRPAVRRVHRLYLEEMRAAIAQQEAPRHRRPAPAIVPMQERPWFYRALAGWANRNCERLILPSDLAEASLALGRVAIALRAHRLERGAYPERLEDLVPSFIRAVPLDPFTGRPPEYAREGGGFVVRSAGPGADSSVGIPERDRVLEWRILR